MDDDTADWATPTCPECHRLMEAVVGAWWCGTCRRTLEDRS